MRKWEYKKIALNDTPRNRDDIDLLSDAGKEGWELVAVVANSVAYLKREVDGSDARKAKPQRAGAKLAVVKSPA